MPPTFPHITNGGESFFLRGSAVGVLCIHGFMASPAELRWLGQHLASQGHTVYGPRLPGHATDYHDMARMRWQDWYTASVDALGLLRTHCDQVFVVGHSMGGMLGLLLAAHHPIDGLAILAAPVLFPERVVTMARWYKWIRPYTDQTDTGPLVQTIKAEQTRRCEPSVGRIRHDQWSSAAVTELFALADVVRTRLHEVRVPLMLLYSEADQTVALSNRDYILSHVQSTAVEQHTLQHSDHILPQDSEREMVFGLVADYIERHSNPGS